MKIKHKKNNYYVKYYKLASKKSYLMNKKGLNRLDLDHRPQSAHHCCRGCGKKKTLTFVICHLFLEIDFRYFSHTIYNLELIKDVLKIIQNLLKFIKI